MTKGHDVHSLSHTKWNCKYHIVFAPKYRRKVFYGQKRYEIGQISWEFCRWKGGLLFISLIIASLELRILV